MPRAKHTYAVVALAVIALFVGAVMLPDDALVGRAGAIFNPAVLDLKLNGQDNVTATLSAAMFSPGEIVRGDISLYINGTATATPSQYDLDFDFRNNVTECSVNFPGYDHCNSALGPITKWIVVEELQYGSDDLLRDPGRNLTRDIDSNPNLGNRNGILELNEIQAGANDLPIPGPFTNPTNFHVGLRFKSTTPNELQGDRDNLTIVFQASDLTHEDLN